MSDVVKRLRDSKARGQEAAKSEGFAAGQTWARDKAEAAELQALENAYDPVYGWGFGSPGSAYSDAEAFFFMISPESDRDRRAAEEFWETILGEQSARIAYSDDFVQGFAEGAMDVWDEVKDQL